MTRLLGLIILIVSLCYGLSYGAERQAYAEWGVAVDRADRESKADTVKFAELGMHGIMKRLDYHIGLGGWTDASHYPGARPSAYIHALCGVETRPTNGGVFAGYYIGPAFVAHPDTILGSKWQVSQEFQIGFKDVRNVRVYLLAKHFSDGGASGKVNIGRNFVGVGVEF